MGKTKNPLKLFQGILGKKQPIKKPFAAILPLTQ